MSEARKTSILAHLRELRQRVIYSVIGLVITTAIAFWQYPLIIQVLKTPATSVPNVDFVYNAVTEGFATSMRVSLAAGVILDMPVIMYNLLRFVTPALTSKERKYVLFILPWVLLMFFGGVYFGYRFLIPQAVSFLLSYGTTAPSGEQIAHYLINLGDYVGFITKLLLIVGCIFEMPVVTTFLSRIGVLSSRWMGSKRKWWVIISFVVAAIITPTPDFFNQTIVAATLIVLYEVSIWAAWLVERGRKNKATAAAT
jgi:sec-independent protein translocase protein TatC